MACEFRHFLLVAAILTCVTAKAEVRFSTVDYLGSRISLTRTYGDFDEYKDDPKNLPQTSIRRVESMMRAVRFGPNFVSEEALFRELERFRFPGYGSFYANQLGGHLDPTLELVYLEIPGGKLNRYFAVERMGSGTLHVVADFVGPAKPEITRVHRRNGSLSFEDGKGKAIAVRTEVAR